MHCLFISYFYTSTVLSFIVYFATYLHSIWANTLFTALQLLCRLKILIENIHLLLHIMMKYNVLLYFLPVTGFNSIKAHPVC